MGTTLCFFNHFANMVGCRCEFYVGTLQCNFKHCEFWPYLNYFEFTARTTNKTFLNLYAQTKREVHTRKYLL